MSTEARGGIWEHTCECVLESYLSDALNTRLYVPEKYMLDALMAWTMEERLAAFLWARSVAYQWRDKSPIPPEPPCIQALRKAIETEFGKPKSDATHAISIRRI